MDSEMIAGIFIGAIGSFLVLVIISFFLCDGDHAHDEGNLGDRRQRMVYEHVLDRETSTGVGTGIGSNGQVTTVVTTSSHVSSKQEVWVTEEYKYNKWIIVGAEFK